MKITDVYTFKDALYNGPFEGETLYNKAHKYGRHDICLEIAGTKRKTADFEENVHLYEETGEQQYKGKATGKAGSRATNPGTSSETKNNVKK